MLHRFVLSCCLLSAQAFPTFLSKSTTISYSASSLSMASSTLAKTDMVAFKKYHGLGNDFILVDDRERTDPSLTPDQAVALCDRNFGIGADGVIFALKPSSGKDDYDFAMRIYNNDGSEPEMCGNGIRCMAQFLKDLGEEQASYLIDTLAGPIVPVMNENGSITVDMGEPILEASKVPTSVAPAADNEFGACVEQEMTDANGKMWKMTAVSMGNPHAVIFLDDLDNQDQLNFEVDGPILSNDVNLFPARTNVEFVQVMSENHLKMKVWERGAGPTLACGTGACALTVAAILAGKITNRKPTTVTLPGGDLVIEWREDDNKIYMTGPATFCFEGMAKVN